MTQIKKKKDYLKNINTFHFGLHEHDKLYYTAEISFLCKHLISNLPDVRFVVWKT